MNQRWDQLHFLNTRIIDGGEKGQIGLNSVAGKVGQVWIP